LPLLLLLLLQGLMVGMRQAEQYHCSNLLLCLLLRVLVQPLLCLLRQQRL
jgi:hypothetical protein